MKYIRCILVISIALLTACADSLNQVEGVETVADFREITSYIETTTVEKATDFTVITTFIEAITTEAGESMISKSTKKTWTGQKLMSGVAFSEKEYTRDWQNAFAEFLDSEEKYWHFALYIYIDDINGDGIPELIFHNGNKTRVEIFYYLNEKINLIRLGPPNMWGKVWYDTENQEFHELQFYSTTTGTYGRYEFFVYGWTSEGYKQTASLFRDSGEYDISFGQAYFNDEPISNDIFEARRDEYESHHAEWFDSIPTVFDAETCEPFGARAEVGQEYIENEVLYDYVLANLFYD